MKRYKVTIKKEYTIDVLAENEEEAKKTTETILDEKMIEGMEHYNQTGDTEFTVYDVTNTDDPFNPENIQFIIK